MPTPANASSAYKGQIRDIVAGTKVHTVGSGGDYSTVAAAIAAIPSAITTRGTNTEVLSLSNGSPLVTSTNANWVDSVALTAPRVGDLIRFNGQSRYYKIKYITNASGTKNPSTITLEENYIGGSLATTSMPYEWYYLDRQTIRLMPGTHNLDGLILPPGLTFVGDGPYTTRIAEANGTNNGPFLWVGEAVFDGVHFAPNENWSSIDGFVAGNPTSGLGSEAYWGGQLCAFNNCILDIRNLGGSHSYGYGSLPILPRGTVLFDNTKIINDNCTNFEPSYAYLSQTAAADTRVIFRNVDLELAPGRDVYTASANQVNMFAMQLEYPATYLFKDFTITSKYNYEWAPISPNYTLSIAALPTDGVAPGSGGSIIDLDNVRMRIINTPLSGTSVCTGLYLTDAVTVNMFGSDIEVTGATGKGIYCNHASAVVNMRASRIKAPTHSIDCAAGTINIDARSSLSGATTGVGTINNLSAPTFYAANSPATGASGTPGVLTTITTVAIPACSNGSTFVVDCLFKLTNTTARAVIETSIDGGTTKLMDYSAGAAGDSTLARRFILSINSAGFLVNAYPIGAGNAGGTGLANSAPIGIAGVATAGFNLLFRGSEASSNTNVVLLSYIITGFLK